MDFPNLNARQYDALKGETFYSPCRTYQGCHSVMLALTRKGYLYRWPKFEGCTSKWDTYNVSDLGAQADRRR